MNRPHASTGAVLVLTLWLLLIVGMLLIGLGRTARIDIAHAHGELQRVQAYWLARAGIARVLESLAMDATYEDTTDDLWYNDPEYFEAYELAEGFQFSVYIRDKEKTRYGLDDLAARLNVNDASAQLLIKLPGVNTNQVDAIIDWRDDDEQNRPGGAERGYYDRLDYPYLIRNGPLQTHREMLLVKNISRSDFFEQGLEANTTIYSYERNENRFGTERINLKKTDDTTLQKQFKFSPSLAQKVRERARNINNIFDLVGERGQGQAEEGQINEITFKWLANHLEDITLEDGQRLKARININTAPQHILKTLPGLEGTATHKIISLREQGSGFRKIGDLFTSNIADENTFKQLAEHITVRSNVVRFISQGTVNKISRNIEVCVDRGSSQPVILYWHQSE